MENQTIYNGEVVGADDPWIQLDNIVRQWVVRSMWQKDLEAYEELRKQFSYS